MKKYLIALLAAPSFLLSGFALAYDDQGGPPRGQERFEEADLNSDGVISHQEMDQKRQERFSEADANGDGFISLDEAIATHKEKSGDRKGPGGKSPAAKMFKVMDIDGDGRISLEETVVMSDRRFKDMDANLDGEVTLLEAKAAMKHKMAGRKGGPSRSRN